MCNEIKYYYDYYYYSCPVEILARSLRRSVNYDEIGVVHTLFSCAKERKYSTVRENRDHQRLRSNNRE